MTDATFILVQGLNSAKIAFSPFANAEMCDIQTFDVVLQSGAVYSFTLTAYIPDYTDYEDYYGITPSVGLGIGQKLDLPYPVDVVWINADSEINPPLSYIPSGEGANAVCFSTNVSFVLPSVRFAETEKNSGFDNTGSMPWLVVPKGSNNQVNVTVTPFNDSLLHETTYQFEMEDSSIASTTNQPSAATTRITVSGKQEDDTELDTVLIGGNNSTYGLSGSGYLGVSVKTPQVVKLAFTFIRGDTDAHSTDWIRGEIPAVLEYLNKVYGKQACVTFIETSAEAPKSPLKNFCDNRGNVGPDQQTNIIKQLSLEGPDIINVFFVWTIYEPHYPNELLNGIADRNARACFVAGHKKYLYSKYITYDPGGYTSANRHTIAHEIGHVLIGDIYNAKDKWHDNDLRMLMYPSEFGGSSGADGKKLRKFEADAIQNTINDWRKPKP